MKLIEYKRICDKCGNEFYQLIKDGVKEGNKSKRKFFYIKKRCSLKCATSHTRSDEQKIYMSEVMKKNWAENRSNFSCGEKQALAVANYTKGKYGDPNNLGSVSQRTRLKIVRRILKKDIAFGCSICGWRETIGDLHHIIPKSNGGTDDHNNITYLCPNHHRIAHKINKKDFITLEEQIGDKWKDLYYG